MSRIASKETRMRLQEQLNVPGVFVARRLVKNGMGYDDDMLEVRMPLGNPIPLDQRIDSFEKFIVVYVNEYTDRILS